MFSLKKIKEIKKIKAYLYWVIFIKIALCIILYVRRKLMNKNTSELFKLGILLGTLAVVLLLIFLIIFNR